MKIKYVALTGADTTVKHQALADLSQKYPFAEWAILFSQSKAGVPRYPSHDWAVDLAGLARDANMNLAAHLCGKWVEDALKGNITFVNNVDFDRAFGRLQLNMGTERLKQAVTCEPLFNAVKHVRQDVIFGGNYRHITIDAEFFLKSGLFPLFDASGGRGVETKDWPEPFRLSNGTPLVCGYAGGLGPDNVADEVARIEDKAKEAVIWIDMETKLRSKSDNFDLEKCEAVLQAAQRWVG